MIIYFQKLNRTRTIESNTYEAAMNHLGSIAFVNTYRDH